MEGEEMKIILTYPDLGEEAEKCLIEWIQEQIDDKSSDNHSPLRYVETILVVK